MSAAFDISDIDDKLLLFAWFNLYPEARAESSRTCQRRFGCSGPALRIITN